MLQRIYGTAFPDKDELDEYLKQLEEAEKRDHRKLGKELGLIAFHPWAPGSAFWLPRGAVLYNTLSQFMRRLLIDEAGYIEVKTPLIFHQKLWETSGHWEHYADAMFKVELRGAGVRPEADELPEPRAHLRHGAAQLSRAADALCTTRTSCTATRPRARSAASPGSAQFAQDDAHIYLRPRSDRGRDRPRSSTWSRDVYDVFGFERVDQLSTRNPEKFMGDARDVGRGRASACERALEKNDIAYHVEPGEAAFYGPKIDFTVEDALGRKWQCATIQLDYLQPERFDLNYIGEDWTEAPAGRHPPRASSAASSGSSPC